MKLKTRIKIIIDVDDWNKLVIEEYKKPYNFQEQDGGRENGLFDLSIPYDDYEDDMNDTIPERPDDNGVFDYKTMGIKFQVWKSRDPKDPLVYKGIVDKNSVSIEMWWERNFYPDVRTLANDLHMKGILETGEYSIEII